MTRRRSCLRQSFPGRRMSYGMEPGPILTRVVHFVPVQGTGSLNRIVRRFQVKTFTISEEPHQLVRFSGSVTVYPQKETNRLQMQTTSHLTNLNLNPQPDCP